MVVAAEEVRAAAFRVNLSPVGVASVFGQIVGYFLCISEDHTIHGQLKSSQIARLDAHVLH
jgi:hypothetical protein